MQTQAAVLWDYGRDWEIEELTLDNPREGEVLVRLTASGLCHSDEHVRVGDLPMDALPAIGGHEGAGIVERVGPEVRSVAEGDHVVLSFVPACGRCHWCAIGRENLCDQGAGLQIGLQQDGTSRHHVRGQDARLMCMLGTFSTHTVVNEDSVVKIDEDIPLDKAALVGCGVTTGFGTAVYGAEVGAGDTVVVLGIGGVGANAVQGARLAGATRIIAIDPAEFNREQARKFGATETFASAEEALEPLTEMTRGALANAALVTVDVTTANVVAQAISLVGKGGKVVLTALAPVTANQAEVPLFEVIAWEKRIIGCLFGHASPRSDIPKLLGLYRDGALLLDELVTRSYTLEQVNDGYEDMRSHRNIRGLIRYE
ncbi:MAG: NDMA-dependent alcohol dehydrogenase [Solirubrobacterales bacterium]|nr:NDMA-dependent alcohol dehydrogenase [Solirubrobacterales bacterium]MBV9716818.1 NDMA-dependent alcohol dehydrogenase [Solirubrobacterales bacterium]